MTTSPLNSAQHVERIREILMGRDLRQVHGRMDRLEDRLQNGDVGETPAIEDLKASFCKLEDEQRSLKSEIEVLKKGQEEESIIDENRLSELTALIDTRFREMQTHIDERLHEWRGQLEQDIRDLRGSKADRNELKNRFARLASAVLEENPPSDLEADDSHSKKITPPNNDPTPKQPTEVA